MRLGKVFLELSVGAWWRWLVARPYALCAAGSVSLAAAEEAKAEEQLLAQLEEKVKRAAHKKLVLLTGAMSQEELGKVSKPRDGTLSAIEQ